MPIPSEELTITYADGTPAFVVLPPGATVGDALAALPARRSQRAWMYALAPLPDGTFVAARWIEVELLALAAGQDITARRLDELHALSTQVDPKIEVAAGTKRLKAGDLPARFTPVRAAEQDDTSMAKAREQRDAHPAARFVILKAGQVLGLFVKDLLGASGLPDDPFARPPAVLGPGAGSAPPVLGFDPGSPPTAAPEAPIVDNRVINGWIEGWSKDSPAAAERTWRTIARDEPLLVGHTYELKLDVSGPRADAIIGGQSGDVARLFEQTDADEVTILVELVVDESEFRLYEEPSAKLIVPREVKPSKNRVSFSLEPLKTGQLSIKVVCYALKQPFLEREVKVAVTDQASVAVRGGQKNAIVVEQRGLTMAGAMTRGAREPLGERISLYIAELNNEYLFILTGATVMRATVRLDRESVRNALANARKDFLDKFVMKKVERSWVYLEENPTIAPDIYRADLEELAWIGRDLFRTLFYGQLGKKSDDAVKMGDRLRELSKEHTLDVKIVSDSFMFPWQLMYDRKDDGPADPDGFWGFKHIIQYMPEFSAGGLVGFGNEISCDGDLPIAVVYDKNIDTQFGFPVVANQRKLFTETSGISVNELLTKDQVFTLFRDENAPPVIYLYIHNVSLFPTETGKDAQGKELPFGTDGSQLFVSDGAVTLRDIKRRADVERPPFKNAPLVFVNACQSAELQPGQYDGLLPYLMQRGARGAIGTEVNTPVNFAARFGAELIAEFAKGEKTLGELLLEKRRFYRDTHNNIMGLIYALYSSGDLIVERTAS
jgi:hypothetical protein